jgi:DNA-binding beta-propeller fold protein YncE
MHTTTRSVMFVAVLSIALAACTPASTDEETTTTTSSDESFAGTVDAPAFPLGLDWINTSEPIALNDLKGKVVVLDFWTYGCINCIHVIPDLKRLEEEYPNELVVIGVHSAKFSNEGVTENLVDIVQRYGLTHPVVNDSEFQIWNQWGATAWPTTALVDPAGRTVGIRSGEGVYDALKPVIDSLIAEFDQAGAMNRSPFVTTLEATTAPARALSYPGKVLATDGRLWVSDTGHHRVLEVDPLTGDVLASWGSGSSGSNNGSATEASFNNPQGLAHNSETNELYVADVGSHAVRVIALETGLVSTLAGTGESGWPPTAGPIGEVALRSPWDVLYSDGYVYVANAGTHQIWTLDLERGLGFPLIGSAREGTANGAFAVAELAQPSGLALSDQGELFFADSESSSIRVGLLLGATTQLVVGADQSLFDFGDVDGFGNEARLQHPLGLALDEDILYVADTYNSKIKRIDVENGGITSWLGEEPGWADGLDPRFNEPGGLSFDDGKLYVADTNNHSVRVIDAITGETSTLVLKGVERFDPPSAYIGEIVTVDPVEAAAGPATLVLNFQLPAGYKVNEDAPSSVVVSGGRTILDLAGDSAGDLTGTTLPATVAVELTEGSSTVSIDINLVYCAEVSQSLCLIDRVRYNIPITVGPAGESSRIQLARIITAT